MKKKSDRILRSKDIAGLTKWKPMTFVRIVTWVKVATTRNIFNGWKAPFDAKSLDGTTIAVTNDVNAIKRL